MFDSHLCGQVKRGHRKQWSGPPGSVLLQPLRSPRSGQASGGSGVTWAKGQPGFIFPEKALEMSMCSTNQPRD